MATKAEHVEVVSVLVRARLSGAMPRLYPPDRVATDGAERDTRFRGALCVQLTHGASRTVGTRESLNTPMHRTRPALSSARLSALQS